jgi:hypothetical protein
MVSLRHCPRTKLQPQYLKWTQVYSCHLLNLNLRRRSTVGINGDVPTDKTVVTAASAGASNANDTGMTDTRTTAAADQHRPIPAAIGRDRRCDGLAAAEHHVRAVPRRLHPHSPCTGLGLASHRHILGYGTSRPTLLHETSVIETVTASHVIGVLLSEYAE